MASKQQENRSVWLVLKNRTFFGLWITGLVSGCCVSAHDTAATWLMNALGASPFLLSLMATSASSPFFLFALPAGVISDFVNRQKLLIATYLWLAVAAALLAISTWFNHISFLRRLFCSVSALPLELLSGRQLFPRSFRKVNCLQR